MPKKRKLNSKNPKYWDKSLLKEKKVIKEVFGTAEIRDAATKNGHPEYGPDWGCGTMKVTAVWYENE